MWKRTGFPSLCWQAWKCMGNIPPQKKKKKWVKPMFTCGRCGRASHICWVFILLAFYRLVFKGMGISRPDAVIGKCRMIRHSRDRKNEPNPERCVSSWPTAGLGVPPALPALTAWLFLCRAQRWNVERLQPSPPWLSSLLLLCKLPPSPCQFMIWL